MIDDLSQLLKQQKWKIETNLGDSVYVWLLGQSFVLPEASDAPLLRLQI